MPLRATRHAAADWCRSGHGAPRDSHWSNPGSPIAMRRSRASNIEAGGGGGGISSLPLIPRDAGRKTLSTSRTFVSVYSAQVAE